MWAKWAAWQYSWFAHEGLRLINWFSLKNSIFIKNQVPLGTVYIVYINNPGALKGELVHITTLAMNTNFNFTCWQFRSTWDMYLLLTSLIMVRFWCGLHRLKALDRLFQMVMSNLVYYTNVVVCRGSMSYLMRWTAFPVLKPVVHLRWHKANSPFCTWIIIPKLTWASMGDFFFCKTSDIHRVLFTTLTCYTSSLCCRWSKAFDIHRVLFTTLTRYTSSLCCR